MKLLQMLFIMTLSTGSITLLFSMKEPVTTTPETTYEKNNVEDLNENTEESLDICIEIKATNNKKDRTFLINLQEETVTIQNSESPLYTGNKFGQTSQKTTEEQYEMELNKMYNFINISQSTFSEEEFTYCDEKSNSSYHIYPYFEQFQRELKLAYLQKEISSDEHAYFCSTKNGNWFFCSCTKESDQITAIKFDYSDDKGMRIKRYKDKKAKSIYLAAKRKFDNKKN